MLKLNIGSGSDRREGWTCMDIDSAKGPDIIHDMRSIPLPFADKSVDYIYMEMALSQLDIDASHLLLADCRRMLAKGGVIRIHEFDFVEWERRWPETNTVLGKTTDWTRAERHYIWSRRYHWEMIYDRETLRIYLRQAGFHGIREVERMRSRFPDLRGLEKRKHGFVMEAGA